jgi:hypothetical protein
MHIIRENELPGAIKGDFTLLQKFGNYTGDFATALCNSRRQNTHQADGSTAIYQANVEVSEAMT